MTKQEAIDNAIHNWEFVKLQEILAEQIGPQKSDGTQLPIWKDEEEKKTSIDINKIFLEEMEKEKVRIDLTRPFVSKQAPHTCPVCNGSGRVDAFFYHTQINQGAYNQGDISCRSCGGGGILWN